jgi:ribosomal protein L37AE/L43A
MNEHGYCPNCGMDFDGGLIWDTGLEMYGSEEEADEYAKAYGATRTTGRWGKRIGLYDVERDMTTRWMCPECKHEWPR